MAQAILSVHDKTGLIEFARGLRDLGWRLIASGGTAKTLRDNQIAVTEVAEYTGSPEILGGRVKTLHPAIHGGLLARATDDDLAQLKNLGWDYIDLVACNLYPFEQTIGKPNVTHAEAIENIDIGGVTLIRAAAKNHARVTLVCDPRDYASVLTELRAGNIGEDTRKRLALKGFALTAQYDAAIANYLAGGDAFRVNAYRVQTLRYGENPHQAATLYSYEPGAGPLGGKFLQGKELSYNNLLDLDAAWRAAVSFERPTICIVKHLSPCGIASADKLADAYAGAFASDTRSAFGGVIASNRAFDGDTARALGALFVECIAAPGFTDDARAVLAAKKNCRLVAMPDLAVEPRHELRSITRGILRQDLDLGDPPSPLSTTGGIEGGWQVVTKRAPTADELRALKFAWRAVQHVKSNAIVFARGEATVGIGGGQPNRVDCVRIAAERAQDKSRGAVMASDAFFPFADSVQVAAQAGITAIVQPGGSQRDAEAIAAADAANLAMVVTGVRHFRH
ncbi:MAG: bifunctional phosphoribosylaminoimidazolecarboxamide formyltransferase/IMP cyclohydrolase [Chloroflexi bacterium]|nr:bifunctional phosphoribosylaminoimidazolecarboxamide formyltransferase/IMP cyclohydrolase [Chloroflexota bacterium]